MERDLKIIVAGTTCAGKSSMLFYLEQLLKREGFTNVEVSMEDNLDFKDIDDFHKQMSVNAEERQTLIKGKKITLIDRQLMRDGKENTRRIEAKQGYEVKF
jgi:tRNA uridine 5-carbamoylmethylation protein Kti12